MNIKKSFSLSDELAKRIAFALFLAYAFFTLYACIHIEAMVLDENWFWGLSRDIHWHHSIKEALFTQNYLGYGALYWQILKVIKSFAVARFLWAVMLISIPVCICVFCKTILGVAAQKMLAALMLCLSCPFTWFTGKIIGSEVLGQFLWLLGSAHFFLLLFLTLSEWS